MSSKKIADNGNIKAFLGSGAEFEGLLSFDGTVRIDGVFKGEINTKDCLIIGETGKVDAEIQVGTMVVMGRINGNVKAENKVEIASTGHVNGDIATSSLIIHEGAVLEGNIHMEKEGARQAKANQVKTEEAVADSQTVN